jgi:hypothetical protein
MGIPARSISPSAPVKDAGAGIDQGAQTGVTASPPAGGPPDPPDPDADGGAPNVGTVPGSEGAPTCDGSGEYSRPASGWRCENTESYAQGPNYERVAGATSVQQCLDACSARPDCTAVSDYSAVRPYTGCFLEHADCETRSKAKFAEEDGGRTHRKVCDGQGMCHFEEVPDNVHCGKDWDSGTKVDDAQSIEDCYGACLQDTSCTAVRDYFYLQSVPGCYLNTSTCDGPVRNFQDGVLYVKCK